MDTHCFFQTGAGTGGNRTVAETVSTKEDRPIAPEAVAPAGRTIPGTEPTEGSPGQGESPTGAMAGGAPEATARFPGEGGVSPRAVEDTVWSTLTVGLAVVEATI
jgi:hypothetical protein